MNRMKKTAITAAASISLLAAGTASAAPADVSQTPASPTGSTPNEQNTPNNSLVKKVSSVQGIFSFEQESTTPNARIATLFRKSTVALCSATDDFVQANPLDWKIEIGGDVSNPCTIDVGEAAKDESVEATMTCTCGGNGAGGAAIYNGDVKGIPVTTLIGMAQPDSAVNTVTFISSDGHSISIPKGYVIGRHAVISYEINGEDLSASVGGNNQLFMSSTAANYLIRDIVRIEVTYEETPPATPGQNEWDVYPNRPNVGVMEGSAL